MNRPDAPYVHALRFSALNSLYDPVVALTTREATFKNRLLAAASLQANQTVLDVGCGTGTLAIKAKRQEPTLNVHGVDGDSEILKRALEKSTHAGDQIDFQQGFSIDLPYPDGRFDRVLSSLFFHHLTRADKLRTFDEIHRVLHPGGELHVADWGVPQNLLMRVCYLGIQLLDGFETTRDNAEGLLPELMQEAGFVKARLVDEVSTMFGTMAIYSATKPASA